MTDEVVVRVPATHVPAVTQALRVGARTLLRDDRTKPAGTPAYDARPALALAQALIAAEVGNETGHDPGEFVTVSMGERETRVPARTIRQWASSGLVAAHHTGSVWLIHRGDLERVAEGRR